MNITLSYIGVNFSIDFTNASEEIRLKVMNFFEDYFVKDFSIKEKDSFEVIAILEKSKNINEILEYGHSITIHNSKKPSVHEEGVILTVGLVNYIYNKATKAVYEINRLNKKIRIYNADSIALVRDIIRVSRDIVKVCAEKLQSGILLHGASVVSPSGRGLLLVGNKGSGKSTVMLELIYAHGYKEVSRDRTFVVNTEKDNWRAYGFPNYYNLTARTIRTFKSTRHLLGSSYDQLGDQALDNVSKKWQCLPQDIGITTKMRTPECDIFRFICLETKEGEVDDVYAANCFSPFDLNYPNWHNWFAGDSKNEVNEIPEVIESLTKIKEKTNSLIWKYDLHRSVKELVCKIEETEQIA